MLIVLALFQRRVSLSGWVVVTWRTLSHKILDRKWDLHSGGRVVFDNLAYTQGLVVSLGNPTTIKSCDRHGGYWRLRRSMRGKRNWRTQHVRIQNKIEERSSYSSLRSEVSWRFVRVWKTFWHPQKKMKELWAFALQRPTLGCLESSLGSQDLTKILQILAVLLHLHLFSSLFISASSHFSGSSPCLWSGKCRTCGMLRDLDEFLAKSFLLHFGLSLTTPFGSHKTCDIPFVWSASLCQGEIQYCAICCVDIARLEMIIRS